ncbi:MAG: di-heme-cytochrome C peroxidase [Geminicoccaceae bacterium]
MGVSLRARFVGLLGLIAAVALGLGAPAQANPFGSPSGPVAVPQGPNWTPATRLQFYSQDQGSQIMPLSWLEALQQPNGKPFLGSSLARYGYLRNPASPTPGLPVGFTVNGTGADTMVGMTCAACHTRQISSGGVQYRIDGGPALVDFQSFLEDLDTAVGAVVAGGPVFAAFAEAVLGPSPPPAEQTALMSEVQAWYLRFHTLVERALPDPAWGLGRLDAVSMIFNRLTGLDLGPPPSYLIPDNIQEASAPVRYPFLWNAAIQDHTQWPGFADNGNTILGLARNVGEVYGVFANFAPEKTILGVDYLATNSANVPGLLALEELIKKIGPPQWPWTVNNTLADQGQAIFDLPTAQGGCVDCHGIEPGAVRPIDQQTWLTPVVNVGTDTHEYDIMAVTAQSGVLNGAYTLANPTPIKPVDLAINILGMAVLGSIEQYCLEHPLTCVFDGAVRTLHQRPRTMGGLKGFLDLGNETGAYESRVLQGIWAAAPYLHNGSVPTLAQLLTPAAQRVTSFAVGPAYDQVNIGLAASQPGSRYVFQATGCDQLDSGNSNCGHEYGTNLSAANKRALLEYLKVL